VVGLAVVESRPSTLFRQEVIVVTEERFVPRGRPRIPNVCAFYDLRYLTIHQMMFDEGYKL
jgi:hypothetical protein